MENNNEIIINAKVKKPLTEAQKEKIILNSSLGIYARCNS